MDFTAAAAKAPEAIQQTGTSPYKTPKKHETYRTFRSHFLTSRKTFWYTPRPEKFPLKKIVYL